MNEMEINKVTEMIKLKIYVKEINLKTKQKKNK